MTLQVMKCYENVWNFKGEGNVHMYYNERKREFFRITVSNEYISSI